ncbi:MAG: hypothetical protein QOE90_1119 [Thermoplasmata archaeon]|jgi:hypothetical protein|nr:hypothetical protein [Thermoplasmata archaeon]
MRRFLPLLLAALLAIPSAGATWGAYGSLEPDTPADREGGLMWAGPPGDALDRVYFNVAAVEQVGGAGPSPNSATLGSRVAAEPVEGFVAILGVWVDCNRDGYVGLADGALREYAAQASAAAGFPVDPRLCPSFPANHPAVHDGDGWVTELLPLEPVPPRGTEPDLRVIEDPEARVWGDHVAPGATMPAFCGGPDGYPDAAHARHTGGLLDAATCLAGAPPPLDALAPLWRGGPADLDAPASPLPEATGDPYALLAAAETRGAQRARTAPDVVFAYAPQSRLDCETLGPSGCGVPGGLGAPELLGPLAALDGALPAGRDRPALAPGGWSARPGAMPALDAGPLPRMREQGGGLDAPLPQDAWTFEAHVGPLPDRVPGGASYASEWCGDALGPGAPPVPGFDCDPSDWDPAGPRPGDAYELRDVDVADGTIVAASRSPTGEDVRPPGASAP